MGVKILFMFLISFPALAVSKCPTEKILHDKVEILAKSKPMERPYLIKLIKAECPGWPENEYNRLLQVVASESKIELCLRSYLSGYNKNSPNVFFDQECISKKFSSDWKALIKKTNADPVLLAQDSASDWDKVVVRDQGKGIFEARLGSSHCLLLSVIESKIDSSKRCSLPAR